MRGRGRRRAPHPSTHDPPHEQLLVRLGAGGVVLSSSPLIAFGPCHCCHPPHFVIVILPLSSPVVTQGRAPLFVYIIFHSH